MSDESNHESWFIFDVYTPDGAKITVKECDPGSVKLHLEQLFLGFKEFLKEYPKFTFRPPSAQVAPPPKPDAAAQIAAEEGNQELAAQLAAEADDIGLPPDGKEWRTADCVFVKILPQPDGKVTIEFYGNDRKQPHNDYLTVKVSKWSVINATGLMKYVTSADLNKPAEFSLPCRVFWTDGKQYTKPDGSTGNYKDVAHVRPL